MQINPKLILASLIGAAALTLTLVAGATPITINSPAIAPITLGASADTLSFNAGSISVDPTAGVFTLQTGDFRVGNSPIPDQVIPFSFLDAITFNGVTRSVTISGEVQITATSDILSIFGGVPIQFGGSTLIIQPLQAYGYNIGDDVPVRLQAAVTPEPISFLLLATGVIGGLFCVRSKDTGWNLATRT